MKQFVVKAENKDILEIVKGRRSTGKYKKEQIKQSQLNQILETGIFASFVMGKQSARMIVVQNPELRERLRKCNANMMNEAYSIGVCSCYIQG